MHLSSPVCLSHQRLDEQRKQKSRKMMFLDRMQKVRSLLQRDVTEFEHRLIAALDSMSLLAQVEADSLISLLKIFDQISVSCDAKFFHNSSQSTDMSGLVAQVRHDLAEEWISEAQQLCQILENPHIASLMRVCDAITYQRSHYNPSQSHHDYYNVRPVSRRSATRSRSGASVSREVNPIYQSIDSHLTTYQNHEYDVVDYGYDRCDRSSVKTCESRFSVKLVQIVKGNEPLGMTVQVTEDDGPVVVSRILYGGAVYRSGLISAGDFIYEVNGVSLVGRTHSEAIRLLERESQQESISFRVVVHDASDKRCFNHRFSNNNVVCREDLHETGIFLKCHFDYSPDRDSEHPCPDVGLFFRKGDILEIVSQEDENWWQARHETDMEYSSRAGIVPSNKLQEKRLAAARDLKRQQYLRKKVEIIPGFKSPIRKAVWSHKVKKVMYNVNDNRDFEENDLPTYEEVVHLYPTVGFCRPIVLFGSSLNCQKKIVRRLKLIDPDAYRTPIAHTTRPAREWELDGAEYFFVTKEWFVEEAKAGNLIEQEEYKENLYGIHRDTVRDIIASGSVCILSLQSQGLKAVRNPLFKPFVIFLKPDPKALSRSMDRLSNDYGWDGERARNDLVNGPDMMLSHKVRQSPFRSLNTQQKHRLYHDSSELEYLYGHYFDVIILVSDDIEDVVRQIVQAIRCVQLVPQWAPASWL